MRRTNFGEPRPATFAQITEALLEIDLLSDDAQAIIQDSRDAMAPYTGWTAHISHADIGEPGFETCGFADKQVLIDGLIDLGIALIVED